MLKLYVIVVLCMRATSHRKCVTGASLFLTTATNAAQTPAIVINEVNYDELRTEFENKGSPGYEFVELYDGGTGNTPLIDYFLVRVNHRGHVTATFNLSDESTDHNGFYVMGGVYLSNRDRDQPGLMCNKGGALALYKVTIY